MLAPATATTRRHTSDTAAAPPRHAGRAEMVARSVRLGTDSGMCDQPTAAAPSDPTPWLVDEAALAGLLRMGPDTVHTAASLQRWRQGELPVPVHVGRNSHRDDGRSGVRRWWLAEVEAFLGLRARVDGAPVAQPACLGCCVAAGQPRLATTRDLAVLLGLGYDTVKHYAEGPEPAWLVGDLPAPIRIGADASLDGGQRRWDHAEIVRWVTDRQRRAYRLYGLAPAEGVAA